MLNIKTFTFNPFAENTYILYNEDKQTAIIDPGCYTEAECNILIDFINDNKLQPILLINTHCHMDHVFGNEFMAKKYNLPAHIHKNEQFILDHLAESATRWGVQANPFTGKTIYINEVDIINIGNDALKILFTPGHSPGSICLYSEAYKWIIGGDVLFKESIGRTDLPGGDYDTLMQSIYTKLLNLPDEILVYPGHGEPTTIGHERKHNPFLG